MNTTPIDFVLSERMSETSRAALTTPSQFLHPQKNQLTREHQKQRDRRFSEHRHSAFNLPCDLTERAGKFPDALSGGSGRECVL